MNIKIANRLVELRKKNGYSQEDLANKLGLSRQAVSKWERAEASPDTDNLICLAKLYNISLDDLLSTDESVEDIAEETKEREEEKNKALETNIHIHTEADSLNTSHDEVHLSDDDGDKVHIDSHGIHVTDKDGTTVEVGCHGIHINDKSCHFSSEEEKRHSIISGCVYGITSLTITITYLLLGFLLPNGQGWIRYWMIFIMIPVIGSIYEAFYRRKFTDFVYPCLVTAIYCYLGMNLPNGTGWHPWWVLFFTIPIYYICFDPIDKLIHKNDNNKKEEHHQ